MMPFTMFMKRRNKIYSFSLVLWHAKVDDACVRCLLLVHVCLADSPSSVHIRRDCTQPRTDRFQCVQIDEGYQEVKQMQK